MHSMPNVSPKRFSETLHMRCDDEFLAKLDDLRIAQRPKGGRVPSRADVIRDVIEKQWALTAGIARARKP